MIRLIGIDVDGTLVDSQGRVSDENVSAIAEAVARGISVALVTGRSYPWARPVAACLPEAVALIVSNGAVERTGDGSTIARRLLPAPVARAVLDATRPMRDSAAVIFDRDTERQLVFESMDWTHPDRRGYLERNRPLIARTVPLEDALTEDPIQVMFNGAVHAMRELAAHLATRSEGYAISLTEYEARDFALLDVTSPEATKGRALMWRARHLGVPPEDVMAIGDNLNDLEMLEAVGVPVVMGNAVAPLRQRGWFETLGHDQSGVAHAIRRLAL